MVNVQILVYSLTTEWPKFLLFCSLEKFSSFQLANNFQYVVQVLEDDAEGDELDSFATPSGKRPFKPLRTSSGAGNAGDKNEDEPVVTMISIAQLWTVSWINKHNELFTNDIKFQ